MEWVWVAWPGLATHVLKSSLNNKFLINQVVLACTEMTDELWLEMLEANMVDEDMCKQRVIIGGEPRVIEICFTPDSEYKEAVASCSAPPAQEPPA
jgi:hypothetical protein